MRKILFAGFISMAVLIVFYGCGEDSEGEENGDDNGGIRPSILSPADVLPDEDDISNWKNLMPPEEANDYDGLYDLIIDAGKKIAHDAPVVFLVLDDQNYLVHGCST